MPTPKAGYRLADGTRVPGTTTILGRFKESGALINWAWKQGRDGKNLYETRDAAADVGTFVHAMIEAQICGKPLPAPPAEMSEENVRRGRDAFAAFTRWAEGSRLEIAPVEVPLICEHHLYGGTADAIAAEADDTLSLLDWKSSKSFYPDNLIQLAAYRHLWNENHPEQQITGCIHVVRFGKEGADFEHRSFPLTHPKLAIAWKLFLHYREAYDLDRQLTGK